jgi:hypothetical protein
MACLLNTGYSLGCRDNIGGIQKVYVRNWSASTTWSYDSNGQITGGTNTSTSWYTLEQRNETAEFKQEGQHSLENGTNFWQQNVNLVFHKYQASIRNLVYVMAQTEMELIILDQNGNYFLVGEQNGANLIASAPSVGKAFGDLNGSTVGFQAKEPSPSRQLGSTFISTLTFV